MCCFKALTVSIWWGCTGTWHKCQCSRCNLCCDSPEKFMDPSLNRCHVNNKCLKGPFINWLLLSGMCSTKSQFSKVKWLLLPLAFCCWTYFVVLFFVTFMCMVKHLDFAIICCAHKGHCLSIKSCKCISHSNCFVLSANNSGDDKNCLLPN